LENSLLFKAIYKDDTIPPPYKNTYSLEVRSVSDGLLVDYDLKYLERETVDEDEIYLEGFTSNDDFSWKGKLGLSWKKFMEEFVRDSSFKAKTQSHIPLKVEIPGTENPRTPENPEDWQYVLQEFTQAIFEEAGKEAALEIIFLNISKEKTTEVSAVISFADRTFSMIYQAEGKVNKTKKDWKESKYLMQTVYNLEYLEGKALNSSPTKPGKYINTGDGAWYELGKSVINPGKKINLLAQLEKLFSLPTSLS
jgi:hypothetical protein